VRPSLFRQCIADAMLSSGQHPETSHLIGWWRGPTFVEAGASGRFILHTRGTGGQRLEHIVGAMQAPPPAAFIPINLV